MRKSIFPLLALIILSPLTASAVTTTTSHVEIEKHSCQRSGSRTSCRIETGADLGGAKYRLSLVGDTHALEPILKTLGYLRSRNVHVVLNLSNVREQTGSEFYSGTLESILLTPYND